MYSATGPKLPPRRSILTYLTDAGTMRTSPDSRKGRLLLVGGFFFALVEEERQYYNHLLEEHEVEEERRSHLILKEKMAENGSELQRRLDRNAGITILLQPSLSALVPMAVR